MIYISHSIFIFDDLNDNRQESNLSQIVIILNLASHNKPTTVQTYFDIIEHWVLFDLHKYTNIHKRYRPIW